VWVLVILGTLKGQHFSRILEETLDIISFLCGYIVIEAIVGVIIKLVCFWEMCSYKYRFQNTTLHAGLGHRMGTFELGSGDRDSFHPLDFHLNLFADAKDP